MFGGYAAFSPRIGPPRTTWNWRLLSRVRLPNAGAAGNPQAHWRPTAGPHEYEYHQKGNGTANHQANSHQSSKTKRISPGTHTRERGGLRSSLWLYLQYGRSKGSLELPDKALGHQDEAGPSRKGEKECQPALPVSLPRLGQEVCAADHEKHAGEEGQENAQ